MGWLHWPGVLAMIISAKVLKRWGQSHTHGFMAAKMKTTSLAHSVMRQA